MNKRVAEWADRPNSNRILAGLSFAESSFFPVPPDVLLAPMTLAHPDRGWRYATLVTIASVLGGLLGYLIGLYGMELVTPLIEEWGMQHRFAEARALFDQYGLWIVFLAGFSPIPYKLFTITAGAMVMSLPLFLLASLVGRGARFYLVAAFMIWGGPRFLQMEKGWMVRIGWITLLFALIYYLLWH
jgi:membrane protein YqaA with SNARE-associated domain